MWKLKRTHLGLFLQPGPALLDELCDCSGELRIVSHKYDEMYELVMP